jgi:lysyl-tRNA synthetase class 2
MQAIKAIRSFFDNQEFYEVETPILQISPVMDAHIHAFKTEFVDHAMSPQGAYYLHTSPEFAMKKLMVAGLDKIYQICHVFRNAERTARHSPEFTMIEWYRAPGDYTDIMNDCENLLRHVAQTLNITHYRHKNLACDPFKDWQRMTIAESFRNYAEIEIDDCLNDIETFRARIAEQGIRTADDDRWDDLFFRVMAEKIEPHLGMDVPTILYDYPASMASLSRKKPSDPRYAERFELYVCGIELANAFSELTNAAEQRARFIEEMALKNKLYSETYPIDEDFITALEHGLPESGGIALGLDRLIMLATGAAAIRDVLWSPVAEAL